MKAVTATTDDAKMTFDRVKRALKKEYDKLTGMKMIPPKLPQVSCRSLLARSSRFASACAADPCVLVQAESTGRLNAINADVERGFRDLSSHV